MAMRLVAPEGVLYIVTDTAPGQEDLKALAVRRKDKPPLKNIYQLFGWTQSARNKRRAQAGDWQLLEDINWAENGGVYIEERPNARGGAAEAGTAMQYEPTARS